MSDEAKPNTSTAKATTRPGASIIRHRLYLTARFLAALLAVGALAFKDWPTIFPNAACTTALIDRLVHHSEIISIEGESYRKREAELTKGGDCHQSTEAASVTVGRSLLSRRDDEVLFSPCPRLRRCFRRAISLRQRPAESYRGATFATFCRSSTLP